MLQLFYLPSGPSDKRYVFHLLSLWPDMTCLTFSYHQYFFLSLHHRWLLSTMHGGLCISINFKTRYSGPQVCRSGSTVAQKHFCVSCHCFHVGTWCWVDVGPLHIVMWKACGMPARQNYFYNSFTYTCLNMLSFKPLCLLESSVYIANPWALGS